MPCLFSNITKQASHAKDDCLYFTVTLPDDMSFLRVNFGGAKIRTDPLVPKIKRTENDRTN